MEKAREFLELSSEESESVSGLIIHPHRVGHEPSFYDDFALRGIRVDRVEPGLVMYFQSPSSPHRKIITTVNPLNLLKDSLILHDRTGKLASGAIANLVDEVGGAVVHVEGLPMNVSVDMSISFLSTAKLDDELELTSRVLGQKGGYSGTVVLIRNKATGELIAEGRHSLFGKHASKL